MAGLGASTWERRRLAGVSHFISPPGRQRSRDHEAARCSSAILGAPASRRRVPFHLAAGTAALPGSRSRTLRQRNPGSAGVSPACPISSRRRDGSAPGITKPHAAPAQSWERRRLAGVSRFNSPPGRQRSREYETARCSKANRSRASPNRLSQDSPQCKQPLCCNAPRCARNGRDTHAARIHRCAAKARSPYDR